MQKVRIIVTSKHKVVRSSVALILSAGENFEIVGREGTNVLEEASELQPDLIVYELCSTDEAEYEVLRELRELCGWTKIIIISSLSLRKNIHKRFMGLCDGYLQEPILPGFLLKAVELVCYSGYFCFLGSLNDIKTELREDVGKVLPINFSNKN